MDKYLKIVRSIESSFTEEHFESCEKLIAQLDNEEMKNSLTEFLEKTKEEKLIDMFV